MKIDVNGITKTINLDTSKINFQASRSLKQFVVRPKRISRSCLQEAAHTHLHEQVAPYTLHTAGCFKCGTVERFVLILYKNSVVDSSNGLARFRPNFQYSYVSARYGL